MQQDIPIEQIVIGKRRRSADRGKVDDLAASIVEIGLINPITVTPDHRLIAGLHRLEAMRVLGWPAVPAIVQDLDPLDAELTEIDENLIRADLSVLERGEHLRRRNEIIVEKGMRRDVGRYPESNGETVSPLKTTSDIAREIGLSERSAQQGMQIARDIPPDVRDAIRDTDLADSTTQLLKLARMEPDEQRQIVDQITNGGAGDIREAKRKILAEENARRAALVGAVPLDNRYRLICSSVADLDLGTGAVDVIITDPPYPEEFLSVYEELAHLAAYALKPGGSLVVMVGQSYLPTILSLMTPIIRYHWTVAYLTPGGQSAQLWQRNVNTFWKPLLWFVNGDYAGDWHGDVIKSDVNDNDKRFHHWGQSESGMARIVEAFSRPGDTILDPFCGGGTTGVVALNLARTFIGADSSPQAIEQTRQRLVLCDAE